MKKIVRLTESDLARIVKRVMNEGMEEEDPLEGHISVYNEYKDGKISKDLFYRFIGVLDRRDKERLLDHIRSEENESESLNEDEVETNDSFDFSHTEKKLFDRFLTERNGFKHIGTYGDMEAYSLKRSGFALVLMVMPSNDPSKVYVKISLKFPMGKIINYLDEVHGKAGMEFKMNDYNGLVRQLQAALDFGKAQHEYDTLPPLK
jgi:hypothetical protein